MASGSWLPHLLFASTTTAQLSQPFLAGLWWDVRALIFSLVVGSSALVSTEDLETPQIEWKAFVLSPHPIVRPLTQFLHHCGSMVGWSWRTLRPCSLFQALLSRWAMIPSWNETRKVLGLMILH